MNQEVKPIYLDAVAVAAFVSLSEATIQKLVRASEFPKPRAISAHRVAWLTREVEEWAEARPVSTMLPAPQASAPVGPASTPSPPKGGVSARPKRAIPSPRGSQSSLPKQ
jgi:prophage regulatory protein